MQERVFETALDPQAGYGYIIEPAFVIYKLVKEKGKEITPREALEEFLKSQRDKSRIVLEVMIAKARGLSENEILATPNLVLSLVPTWWDKISQDDDSETVLAELEEMLVQRIAYDDTLTPLDRNLGKAAVMLQRHVSKHGVASLAHLDELGEQISHRLAYEATLTPLDRLLGEAAVLLKRHLDQQR